MPTGLSVELSRSELIQVVESVFVSMLALESGECDEPWSSGGEQLTAAVHLAGEWNGSVLLECDRIQACRFSGRFLSMAPPQTVDDVVRDLLGEITNMIGGNLKCVLARGIQLSMPSVVDGGDYCLYVCGAEVRERIVFRCADGLFRITILATRASDPGGLRER